MFGKPDDRDAKIVALQSETEDDADEIFNERQLLAEADARVAAMIKARDPAQMDQIALDAAASIEDIFAQGWEGGVTQRKARIQRLVRGLIDDALLGAHSDKI